MPDYGHDLLFGTFLTPAADDPQRVLGLAHLTDALGLDLVTIQDHPYQPSFLDAWTLLAAIAATTTSVRVAPNVANLPLRPPAVLARAVASLDLISGGRVELGLGAGAFWDPIVGMGGRRLTPGESVTALEEGIAILRGLWAPAGRRGVVVDGTVHAVHGARPGPAPAHDVGIWLGAYKPRMLALTGRLADGWIPSQPYAAPDTLGALNAAIDDAAVEAGRSPADVRRLYNVNGTFAARGTGFLEGPPEQWAEDLAELALAQGMSAFILGSDDPDAIRVFAAEVAPAVRELVGEERARRAAGGASAAGEGADGDGRAAVVVAPSGAQPAVAAPRPTAASAPGPSPSPSRTGSSAADLAGIPVTPDDGSRLSAAMPWDESTRPTAPPAPADAAYTSRQQAAGRHLVDIHDHLRSELTQVRDVVDQVLAGTADPALARDEINRTALRQNDWTLGAFCASYCRVVTTHHTIEDQHMFPALRRVVAGIDPVIDRLEAEHHVIHDVLTGLDDALVAFVTSQHRPEGDPQASAAAARLRSAVDLLTDTLLSHLSYEERELVEPIARSNLIV
ncbi:MAG: LLM class flavin-dependent oxidoreductase [Kineosporiaceae bacterium]